MSSDLIAPNIPVIWTTDPVSRPFVRWIGRIAGISPTGHVTCHGVMLDVDGKPPTENRAVTHNVPVERVFVLKVPKTPVRAELERSALADLLGDGKTDG